MEDRISKISRNTRETNVRVELNIDGKGETEITTGILFFDHMLDQLARHGKFDLKLSATGSDSHHVVEDVGICLGKAYKQALGEKKGIVRMGHAIVPMDESLALVAVDISGRGYSVIEVEFKHYKIGDMHSDLIKHFLISFSAESKINLHARLFCGANDHHKAEAVFKAMALALDSATQIDARIKDILPSTKNHIDT